jgi:hypothetical protein
MNQIFQFMSDTNVFPILGLTFVPYKNFGLPHSIVSVSFIKLMWPRNQSAHCLKWMEGTVEIRPDLDWKVPIQSANQGGISISSPTWKEKWNSQSESIFTSIIFTCPPVRYSLQLPIRKSFVTQLVFFIMGHMLTLKIKWNSSLSYCIFSLRFKNKNHIEYSYCNVQKFSECGKA